MRYVSIDIETTGLDEKRHQILSFGAIIEDTEKKLSFDEIPKFHYAILHDEIIGSFEAISMNSELISKIGNWKQCKDLKFTRDFMLSGYFWSWLVKNEIDLDYKVQYSHTNEPLFSLDSKPINITVAGKNFGTFDKKFIELLPDWKKMIRIHQRVIDPAILFVDWKNDKTLPNLNACLERANINKTVTHNALEDAWDVIQVLRKTY